jgi:hypothetical protein
VHPLDHQPSASPPNPEQTVKACPVEPLERVIGDSVVDGPGGADVVDGLREAGDALIAPGRLPFLAHLLLI